MQSALSFSLRLAASPKISLYFTRAPTGSVSSSVPAFLSLTVWNPDPRHSNRAADAMPVGQAPAPPSVPLPHRSLARAFAKAPAQHRPPTARACARLLRVAGVLHVHPACWRFAGAIATEPTKHAEDHAAMTSLRRAVNSVMCAPPHPSRPSPGLLRARVPLPCSGRPVPEHTVACAACVRVSLRACRSCSCVWLLTGSLRPCIPAPR